MQAIVCRAFGPVDGLRLERVPAPALQPHEVRVQVHAAGVNFADALRAEGRYQVRPPLPWVPGSEVGGVVAEVGRDVATLRAGDRVMGIAPAHGGGYAEQIVLDAARVLPLPAGVGFEAAAATPVAFGTSLYALRQRGRLAAGDTVLVLGAAGGVGLAAVQLAKAMGARVIAAASSADKRALALAQGADDTVDYTQADWRLQVRALTQDCGVDVVYDPVGGDAFDEAVRCMAWGGRYLVVGFTAGRIPALPVNLPLLKGYDLVGVRYDVWRDGWWPEARANLEQVLAWQAEGRFAPVVSARFALADAVAALQAVTGRQVTGKAVLAVAGG